MYKIFRDVRGIVTAINRDDGVSLPWSIESSSFDEKDPLTIELREWESENGALNLQKLGLDLATIRSAKIVEFVEATAECHELLTAGYSAGEKASWAIKVAESELVMAGRSAEAKFLKIEANQFVGSGEEFSTILVRIARRVLKNRDALQAYSSILVGLRTKWTAWCHNSSLEEIVLIEPRERLIVEFREQCQNLGLPIPF